MTFEEAEKLITDEDGGSYLDDHGSEKTSDLQAISEAYKILKEYHKEEDLNVVPEHDQLIVGGFSKKMTEEDVKKMHRLGFGLDEESWYMFC